jgi:mono/diheme cytochrome c family protein
LFYFDNAGLQPDPKQSSQWNLGRYLVEGPGHCGECHTPRNLLGATKPSLHLAGAHTPDGKGNAPNLTVVLADWTNADIVEALTSGFTPDGDVLGGGMTSVVRNLAQSPKSDARRSLPQEPAPARRTRGGETVKLIKGRSLRRHGRRRQSSPPLSWAIHAIVNGQSAPFPEPLPQLARHSWANQAATGPFVIHDRNGGIV